LRSGLLVLVDHNIQRILVMKYVEMDVKSVPNNVMMVISLVAMVAVNFAQLNFYMFALEVAQPRKTFATSHVAMGNLTLKSNAMMAIQIVVTGAHRLATSKADGGACRWKEQPEINASNASKVVRNVSIKHWLVVNTALMAFTLVHKCNNAFPDAHKVR